MQFFSEKQSKSMLKNSLTVLQTDLQHTSLLMFTVQYTYIIH